MLRRCFHLLLILGFCSSAALARAPVTLKVTTDRPEAIYWAGDVLEGTRDINVTGNTFSSVPKALELRGPPSRSTIFANNLLTDAPSDHRNLPADGVGGNLDSPGR